MIFIIDDDEIMAECVARAIKKDTKIFHNAIEAMNALDDGLPEMIFLDILLDGPDGFTFLNELMSYQDTAKIPVVIITSLDINVEKMRDYGVVGVIKKEEMTPSQIKKYVADYCGEGNDGN
ncbi:response regulator [Candidatus Saccharibacteria bacterium]|nr:response regulator [Candidatus Saccharibacteria bacterium]